MSSRFYQFNDSINYLDIDPKHIKKGVEHAKSNNYPNLRIKAISSSNVQKQDLNFESFSNQKFIKKLVIHDDFKIGKVFSVDSLYTLKKLRYLQIMQTFEIDCSHLAQLKSLCVKYHKKIKNIGLLANVEDALFSSVKEQDCLFLSSLKSLVTLRLSGGITELKGLETLENLISLRISHCPKLVDAHSVQKMKDVKKLHVEKCKNLTDFSFLKGNKSIEELFVSEVDSIKFIVSMPNLKKITFWNCKDGDIRPLLRAKKLSDVHFYPNKKHYSHTKEEVMKALNG